MRLVVPVFFDFACPYSYAARPRERRAEEDLDVRFVYLPWELDPDVAETGEPDPEAEPDETVRRFAQTNGGRVHAHPRRHNTRRLLQGLPIAQAHGRLGAYVDEGLRAYREGNENVAEDRVLRKVADESGLEPNAFLAQIHSGTWKPWQEATDAWASQLGVERTVTYVLPGESRPEAVDGLVGEERFRDLLLDHLRLSIGRDGRARKATS